jgi:hypothetical protein
VQFFAKSDSSPTIAVTMTNGVTGQNEGLNVPVALSGSGQSYIVYFQATATDPAAQLNFEFGTQTGNVWLDGVALQGSAP